MNVQSEPYGVRQRYGVEQLIEAAATEKHCLHRVRVAIPTPQLRRPLAPTAGTPQDCCTDQNTDAQRDTYGDQRSVFGLADDPL